MKRIMVAIGICLVFASCSPYLINTKGYTENHGDLKTSWVKTAKYKYIADNGDYWKSPTEFEADGGGDCEDFSAYLIYLLGPDASMVVIKTKKSTYHSIVRYDGKYLEPQRYNYYYDKDDLNIIIEYNYWTFMAMSTLGGTKVLRSF